MDIGKREFESNEVSVAGWISSNDVTLFTLILVLFVAGATYSGFLKQVARGNQLEETNTLTRNQLQETKEELESANDESKQLNNSLVVSKKRSAEQKTFISDLRKQLEKADAEIASLKTQLRTQLARANDTKEQLAGTQDSLAKAQKEAKKLAESLVQAGQRIAELNKQLKTEQSKLDGLARLQDILKQTQVVANAKMSRNIQLARQVVDLESKLEQLRLQANSVVALRGPLENVVFVFDTSESMKRTGRFVANTQLLLHWLGGLQMDRFAVIDFDSRIRHSFGGELRRAIPDARMEAKEFVRTFRADGRTRTKEALMEAFQKYPDVDTMVLFTDGRPTGENGEEISKSEMDAIRDWLQEHHGDVVINTVAVGDFLTTGTKSAIDKMEYGYFLQRIAKDHRGVFIGMGDVDVVKPSEVAPPRPLQ